MRRSRKFTVLLPVLALALCATLLGAIVGTPDGTAVGAPADDGAGHAGHAQPADAVSGDDPDGDGYIPADPPVTGVEPSKKDPPHHYHHEFQANCKVSHGAPDDPIVYPGKPGDSHHHTFMGNTTTDAHSTTASLGDGTTTCKVPKDLSAYWMPTMFKDGEEVLPVGDQTIYYKSGVNDYTSVRPFPKGLRYVVGSPMQSVEEFRNHPGFVEGWECGEQYFNNDFPESCPTSQDTQLNARFQAPSCWDGEYLDTPDHKSHMAYPEVYVGNKKACPDSHPVALPMIEFKMAWPVNGDLSGLELASGRGYSFHYDFFNAWDEATLKALVDHCINGGLQCDARGFDLYRPEEGAALNEDYELP